MIILLRVKIIFRIKSVVLLLQRGVNMATMADEVLFEFLHMELVSHIYRTASKDEKVTNHKNT